MSHERLCDIQAVTPDLLADIIGETYARYASMRHTGQAAHLRRLIEAGAWDDAVLALMEIELPRWQLRRLVYDGGEWHCSLSCQRELPDWLDQATESHHPILALAILSAFVKVKCEQDYSGRPSVPAVPFVSADLSEPVICDNFA